MLLQKRLFTRTEACRLWILTQMLMLLRSCLAFHASSVNKLVDVVDFCVMCLDKSVCVRGECVLCKQLYEIVRLCSSNYSWNDVHIFIWSPFKNYFMHEKINMCKCHRCFVWNVTKSPLNNFFCSSFASDNYLLI